MVYELAIKIFTKNLNSTACDSNTGLDGFQILESSPVAKWFSIKIYSIWTPDKMFGFQMVDMTIQQPDTQNSGF